MQQRLSFAGFSLLFTACAVGTSGSTVRRTTPDGRVVEHRNSSFGFVEPAPGATALEAAEANLLLAQAGCVGALCGRGIWPYGYGGYGYGGVPIVVGAPIGGYTAAGAARSGEVLPHVGRAPNYTIIGGTDVGPEPAAPVGSPPVAPPAPPVSGGGGDASALPPAASACDDPAEYIGGIDSLREEIEEILRTEPLDATALRKALDAADALLDNAEAACAGNEAALGDLRPLREALEEWNRTYIQLTRSRR